MPGFKKSRPSWPFTYLLLLAAAAFAAGCSSANNTTPHPMGATWVTTSPAAQPHGNDAKAAPGATTGFAYCRTCHGSGTDFAGGSSGVSCYTCHGPTNNSPHASQWRTGDTYVHTSTAAGNAPVCAFCHSNGANSPIAPPSPAAPAGTAPGCFNSTLCHGAAAGHPAGWVAVAPAAQPHGIAAKAANGFPGCQICHGAGFAGTASSGNVSCFNNAACHGATATWPHAPAPWRASAGSTYTHTTTVETGNAAVCAVCHFPGSPNNPAGHPPTPAPAGTAPGCFNSTLCHNGGGGGAPHAVPFNDNAHFTVTTATFPASCSACHDVSAPTVKSGPVCQTCHTAASPLTALTCTSCHANPPSGATTAYPNAAGAHATHIALTSAGTPISCDTCHSGLGSGTLAHYNGAKPPRVEPGDVAFPAGFLYTGITGTAVTFDNALTCSNVSCHGALVTPNWRTGATACASCHNSATVAPAFYTDYTQSFITHNQHIGRTVCTTCHTTLPAGTHFGTLSDKAIASRAAAATINPAFAYPSPPPASLSMNNCNTNSVGGCH